ncbi:MAG: hypothetical protein ACRBHB_16265 [Arenicella sp.]
MKNIAALLVSFFISSSIYAVELEFNEEDSTILGEIILYEDLFISVWKERLTW